MVGIIKNYLFLYSILALGISVKNWNSGPFHWLLLLKNITVEIQWTNKVILLIFKPKKCNTLKKNQKSVVDLGRHEEHVPRSIFFHFHAVFGKKIMSNNRLAPPILDWRPLLRNSGSATENTSDDDYIFLNLHSNWNNQSPTIKKVFPI